MKKLIISLAFTVGLISMASAQNLTFSLTVTNGGFNQLVTPNGPFVLASVILSSTNTASMVLIDTDTVDTTTYINTAYTNKTSYATNFTYFYTNYYGVVTTNTGGVAGITGSGADTANHLVLVDVDNTVVRTTNNLPTITVACTSTPTVVANAAATMYRGLWVRNDGPSTATITVTGHR